MRSRQAMALGLAACTWSASAFAPATSLHAVHPRFGPFITAASPLRSRRAAHARGTLRVRGQEQRGGSSGASPGTDAPQSSLPGDGRPAVVAAPRRSEAEVNAVEQERQGDRDADSRREKEGVGFEGVTLDTDEAILEEGRNIVMLCCFVGVISSLDRQAMSVAIVPMSQAMHYSDTVKGSISSIFSLGYTLALLPLGLAQQLVSARLIMAGGVIAWSSFTVLTPFFADMGVPQLLVVRMMVGAADRHTRIAA